MSKQNLFDEIEEFGEVEIEAGNLDYHGVSFSDGGRYSDTLITLGKEGNKYFIAYTHFSDDGDTSEGDYKEYDDFDSFWEVAQKYVNLEENLAEETHAQYAKPEGNRIQAYNNALTYAKKNNCDYIYGYTNHAGKFFALEQPIKAKDSDAEEQFRKQYKNCKVVYMVYPDKAFLKESLYNFTPEEMEEYGCDEEGCSLEGWDTFVRCNWCKEVYAEYDCAFEANLGWLCPRCQDEIRSHGGPLTIMDYPTEDDIRRTLEEAVKMTRDELMATEGTDDVELINAGRPEEERVELVEATINIRDLDTDIFDSPYAAMYLARGITYDLVGEPKDAVKLAKWGETRLMDDEPLILGDLINDALVAGNWHEEAEDYGWGRLPIGWSRYVEDEEKLQMDEYVRACKTRQDKLHLLFLAINNLALEWAGVEGWYN